MRLSPAVTPPPKDGSCYGDRRLEEGEVALTIPGACKELVCQRGQIVEKNVGPPGTINCTYNGT